MVTGDFSNHENGAALRAMLEFESQKHGLPIEFKLVDLSRPPQKESFRKVVQVFCHGVGERQALTLPFPDESIRVNAQAYFMKGLVSLTEVTDDVIGFTGEDYYHPFAHVDGNRLFVYFNPIDVPVQSEDGTNVLGKVFDYVFSKAMAKLKTNIESYDYSDERKRYANIKLMALKSKQQELSNNITTNEYSLQEATESIVRLTRALSADRVMLEAIQSKTDRRKTEEAGKEYFSLMKLVPAAYKDIEFDERELRAKTHSIDIDYEGEEYHIGHFEVAITFETGRIRINNLTNERDGYDHPHVSGGSPCLGNISTGLAKLIAESDYAPALTILLDYLKSYNRDDAYKRIEYWGPDGDSWTDYDNCIENSSTWDCLDCSDRDCPYNDRSEIYSRCWENSSTTDCIECGYGDSCPYHEEAENNCRTEHSPRECMGCQQACGYQFDEFGCREDAEDQAEMDGVLPCVGCDITGCQYAEEEPEPAEADDEVVGGGEQEDNTDRLTAILAEEV
jgi:hypothetical protein